MLFTTNKTKFYSLLLKPLALNQHKGLSKNAFSTKTKHCYDIPPFRPNTIPRRVLNPSRDF